MHRIFILCSIARAINANVFKKISNLTDVIYKIWINKNGILFFDFNAKLIIDI